MPSLIVVGMAGDMERFFQQSQAQAAELHEEVKNLTQSITGVLGPMAEFFKRQTNQQPNQPPPNLSPQYSYHAPGNWQSPRFTHQGTHQQPYQTYYQQRMPNTSPLFSQVQFNPSDANHDPNQTRSFEDLL